MVYLYGYVRELGVYTNLDKGLFDDGEKSFGEVSINLLMMSSERFGGNLNCLSFSMCLCRY